MATAAVTVPATATMIAAGNELNDSTNGIPLAMTTARKKNQDRHHKQETAEEPEDISPAPTADDKADQNKQSRHWQALIYQHKE